TPPTGWCGVYRSWGRLVGGRGGRSRCRLRGQQTREQTRWSLGHGIEPAVTPRVAAADACHGEIAARQRTMALERLDRIDRTGGVEAAAVAQPGAEQQPVGLDHGDQETLHDGGVCR